MKRQIKRLAIFFLILVFPAGCSRLPSGTLIFVTNERGGTISVIDSKTDKVIETLYTGGRARGIRISADGKNAYIALSTPMKKEPKPEDNKILILETKNGAITKSVNVGSDPEQLAVSNDQTLIYVSNEDAGTATITDIKTGEPTATLIVGIKPEGVTMSPDGRWVYVTAETSNTISVIDTEKRAVVKTFMVGGRPRDTAFSPDSKRAYVSAEIGQTLSVVDTEKHEVIATIPLGYNETIKPVGRRRLARRKYDLCCQRARKHRFSN